MLKSFAEIRERAVEKGPRRLAAAGAADPDVLAGLAEARRLGLIEPWAVGEAKAVAGAAAAAGADLSDWVLVDEPDDAKVALAAAGLVRSGKCDLLMKGGTSTAAFMKAVLDDDRGLRGEGLMSHVFVTESARFGRLFLVTDGGINLAPTLEEKAQIIRNALPLARALGCDAPRVAVLAAVEKVNPRMPETREAAELVEMNRSGRIAGCTVAGPYAVDNAVSEEAAAKKGLSGPVAGKADIILVPTVLVGNTFCKGIAYFAGEPCGGCVAGAAAPVVFLSRADDVDTRVNSISLGVLMAGSG